MTRDELNNAYFDWMYQLVCDDEYSRGLSYRKLLYLLHDTDFTFTIALDSNRYDDGIDLRYRFGNEQGYRDSMIASYLDNRPCSVLEMIIALRRKSSTEDGTVSLEKRTTYPIRMCMISLRLVIRRVLRNWKLRWETSPMTISRKKDSQTKK